MKRYNREDFIKEFRPDGKGHLGMEDGNGKVIFDIPFDEIICDLCNAEISGEEGDMIYVDERGDAYCEGCWRRYGNKGK